MKKAVKAILNVLSYGGIEVESARRLADVKKLDPIRIFLRKLDMEIYNGDYKVPIRLFVYFIQELKKRQEITLTGTIRTNKYINLPQFKCYVLKGFIPFYTNFLHSAYIYIFSKGRKKKWNEQDLLPYY